MKNHNKQKGVIQLIEYLRKIQIASCAYRQKNLYQDNRWNSL